MINYIKGHRQGQSVFISLCTSLLGFHEIEISRQQKQPQWSSPCRICGSLEHWDIPTAEVATEGQSVSYLWESTALRYPDSRCSNRGPVRDISVGVYSIEISWQLKQPQRASPFCICVEAATEVQSVLYLWESTTLRYPDSWSSHRGPVHVVSVGVYSIEISWQQKQPQRASPCRICVHSTTV